MPTTIPNKLLLIDLSGSRLQPGDYIAYVPDRSQLISFGQLVRTEQIVTPSRIKPAIELWDGIAFILNSNYHHTERIALYRELEIDKTQDPQEIHGDFVLSVLKLMPGSRAWAMAKAKCEKK